MKKLVIVLTAVLTLWAVAPGITLAAEEHPLVGTWVWNWKGWWGNSYRTVDTILNINIVSVKDGTLEGELIAVMNSGQPNQREYRRSLAEYSAKASVKEGRVVVEISNEQIRYALTLSPDGGTLSGAVTKPTWEDGAVFKKQP